MWRWLKTLLSRNPAGRLLVVFATLLVMTDWGWSATQGQPGPTSSATAKITLRILPRNAEDVSGAALNNNPQLGTWLEKSTAGHDALKEFCQSFGSSDSHTSLKDPHASMFAYHVSATPEPGGWTTDELLSHHCGVPAVVDAADKSLGTLLVAPI